jgi:hypothetical protein
MHDRFFESQRFRQTWVWVLLIGVMLPILLLFGYGLYQQVVLGRPFGNQPLSNGALITIIVANVAVLAAVMVMMWFAHLDVAVRDRELVIRFVPFHLKPRRITLDEIAEAQARQYRPIVEYGGWGIRYGFNGMAYNVSGNEGVQLTLRNGKRILIGSQRSAELARALHPPSS